MNELRLEAVAAEHSRACGDFEAMAARAARLEKVASRMGARNYLCAAARIAPSRSARRPR